MENETQAAESAPIETPETGEAQSKPTASDNALAAELRKTRKALKQAEQRASQYEQEAKAKAEAEMSDLEKYKSKAEELESAISEMKNAATQRQKTSAFKIALAEAGCVDTKAACKLADLSSLELTESGDVEGVKDVLKAFKKSSPYLFGQHSPKPSGGGNPADGAPKVTASDIKNMSHEAFIAHRNKLLGGR